MKKLYIIPPEKRKKIKYALQLTDYSDTQYFNIDIRGVEPTVYMSELVEKDNILLMKLRSTTLLFSLQEEWGGDAIIIGYGCMIEIYDINTLKKI